MSSISNSNTGLTSNFETKMDFENKTNDSNVDSLDNTRFANRNFDTKEPEDGLSLENELIIPNEIKLFSLEGKEYTLKGQNVIISEFIKSAIQLDPNVSEIPLNVKSNILELIIEYMNKYEGVKQEILDFPLKSKTMKENCNNEWDAEYIDRIGGSLEPEKREILEELMLGANYLDIKCLLHLACAKFASRIKGETLETIRNVLESKSENDIKVKTENNTSCSDGSC